MHVIGHDREGNQIDPEMRGLYMQLVFDPCLAMIEVLLRDGIVPQQEATSADACHNMQASDLVGVKDFSANNACHGVSPRAKREWHAKLESLREQNYEAFILKLQYPSCEGRKSK
jgi:hypothetical protein